VKIVVGISGASGAIYAHTLIQALKKTDHQLSLIASDNAQKISQEEMGTHYTDLGVPFFGPRDFMASFASGSNPCDQLVIVPCSMGTLGRVAHGFSDDLMGRTADVCLKERKPLIMVPRETPFSLVHIENMRFLTLAGATIIPAIPSFYSKPETIQDLVNTVIGRVLDHMKVDNNLSHRYKGENV
jgi:flavin prenyltransferase